jgi:hypothetical protein
MVCNQCGEDLETIPVRLTDVTLLAGHVMTGQRGGRERSYTVEVCNSCLVNLSGVPGGDTVKVEPEVG